MKLYAIKDTLTDTYITSMNQRLYTHDINMASIFTNAENAEKSIRKLIKSGEYKIDMDTFFTTDAKKSEILEEAIFYNNKGSFPNYGRVVEIKECEVVEQNLEVTQIKLMEI
jgi:hypothetical protein